MPIAEQIETRLTEAMRSGDSATTSTLRMLKAALKNASIAAQNELSEDQVIAVLQKEVKSRTDSARAYDEGGRAELAEKERGEIALIKEFLPEAPSEEQISEAVTEAIHETGATTMAQMGQVIGAAKAKLGAAADGALIAAEAKRQLSEG